MSGGADVVGQLGPLPIYVFGLMTALGFAVGTAVSLAQAGRLGLEPARMFQAAPLVMLAGVLGGRVTYVLLHWADYRRDWAAIAHLPEGGFVFYGALAGGAAALAWWARRAGVDPWRALDAAAPGLALGQAVGLVGATLPGRPTGLPWAVLVDDGFVHPIPAYGIIFSYWLFFVLWRLGSQWPARGRLFFAYLFLHGVGWMVIDVWSPGPRALGLALGQWAALAEMAAAATAFAFVPRRTVSSPWLGKRVVTVRSLLRQPEPPPGWTGRLWRAGAWVGGLVVLLGLYAGRWT